MVVLFPIEQRYEIVLERDTACSMTHAMTNVNNQRWILLWFFGLREISRDYGILAKKSALLWVV